MNRSVIVSLRKVSKRFVRKRDIAWRILNMMGRKLPGRVVNAVDAVDLDISEGEMVGLVGESGCGKSTLGRIIAGLYKPTEGVVTYRGQPLDMLRGKGAKTVALKMQMIFQDPYSSLNPRMRVEQIIGEAPSVHHLVEKKSLGEQVALAMQRVGLDSSLAQRYPHQLSGGQAQRVGIARALAVNPEFVICDEAVAALDVSVQAQVLNIFLELGHGLGLTYLFISHDLGVIQHMCQRVLVMYLGRIVEVGPTEKIYASPAHPYTTALLLSRSTLRARRHRFQPIKGEIPSPLDPPSGCHFHQRCPRAMTRCRYESPRLKQINEDRFLACHLN